MSRRDEILRLADRFRIALTLDADPGFRLTENDVRLIEECLREVAKREPAALDA